MVEGDGRTLLGRQTAEALNLLRVGPFQANSVDSGRPDSVVREKYKHLFRCWSFEGLRIKTAC